MIDMKDLQAKSDQMNAVDLVGSMIARIEKVAYFPKQDQPIHLHLEGYNGRPFKPCKSMLRGLSQAWGMDEQQWAGGLIEIYCDPEVKWAGADVGGIRISRISRIAEPFTFPVQISKNKRKMVTWQPIPDDQPVAKEFIFTHHESNINEAKTDDEITAIVQAIKAEFGIDKLTELKDVVVAARAKLAEQTAEATEG